MLLIAVALVGAACGGTTASTTTDDATTVATADLAATTTVAATTTAIDDRSVAVCDIDSASGFSQMSCEDMTFDVGIPQVCPDIGCGLIVDVHGYTGSGAGADGFTGLRTLGTEAGYVVVQPNNPKESWDHTIDDERIRSFLDQLIEGLAIDRNRIHFGGFSQGGIMTWRFICDHSDLIASASPAGAGATYMDDYPVPAISCDFNVKGSPAHEVDILYVHGRSDNDVPFRTAIEQRDLVVSAWDMSKNATLADEPDYLWTQWTSATGTVFEFLEHDWQGGFLGGHCYPGASGQVGCGTDTPIHYGEITLQFYIDHPKDE
jgi:poly(3-hydroxybutyrate) depolymerase